MLTKANVIHQTGPPSNFSWEDIEIGEPGQGEVLIEHKAIGVNFIDTYFRSGLYPWSGEMPIIPGAEASGMVQSVGTGVNHVQPGDRVAYTFSNGSYCQHRILPAHRVVKLPPNIDYELAAAAMLKGLTARYLLRETFAIEPGHTVLFHAAAGGVGLFAGQWAAHVGAYMIGTAGSTEKIKLAKDHGYRRVINYREEDFVEKVMELTSGEGVDVVYDSVGKDTYPQSLKCLKRRGMWVSFGQSSGMIENFDLRHLVQHGSLYTTRPTLFDYIPDLDAITSAGKELFDMIENGQIKVNIDHKAPLSEAEEVHKKLESRATTGSTILIP